MKCLIIFLIFISVIKVSLGFFGYSVKYNTHEEPQVAVTTRSKPVIAMPIEKYIEQSLDNFNPQDARRWKMRYYENDVYFQPGGPLFIYLGGEWGISPLAITQGTLIVEMAQELHGNLFYTEHRYYGQSRPTANTTTENLRYLTIDQALADVAQFISYIKASKSDYEDSEVILVGASYSATMAAWMRKKYPHLVTGSFASSGPVQAEIDFFQYKEVMTRSIVKVGGQDCADIIEQAFNDMETITKSENSSRITQAFNLCQDLEKPNDIPHFFYEISDVVAGLVQAHRPGNIERACDFMREQRKTYEAIEAFGLWVKKDETECLDYSYKNNVEKFRNVDWNAVANRQMRQWTYQTCSEFAWFQTSTSKEQIFGTTYPVEYFYNICNDLYDNSFNMEIIEYNVRRTNIRYAGFAPDLTQVVFTNGDLDPWHPVSVLEDLNKSVPSILIPFSAHVSDLGAVSESDSPEMKASKLRVKELVREWVGLLN